MSQPSTLTSDTNRHSTAAGQPATSNLAGDFTSLLGKTIQYDNAGRVSEVTANEQTTTSIYNGMGQRVIRDAHNSQAVFSCGAGASLALVSIAKVGPSEPSFCWVRRPIAGLWVKSAVNNGTLRPTCSRQPKPDWLPHQYTVLSQTQRNLTTSVLSTTEHIYLPTASGPMPVAAVVGGQHYAVHSDLLNTPRRLTDSSGVAKWQWGYSGFGEVAAQALPSGSQAAVVYELRYPGQVDDGNGLFYNFHRFYGPVVGRYMQADPIGLEGGINTFAYVGGNPLMFTDPTGEIAIAPLVVWGVPIIIGATWWNTANKRPRWPDRPSDDGKPDGEPWPKDDKGSCIRTYANCVNY